MLDGGNFLWRQDGLDNELFGGAVILGVSRMHDVMVARGVATAKQLHGQ